MENTVNELGLRDDFISLISFMGWKVGKRDVEMFGTKSSVYFILDEKGEHLCRINDSSDFYVIEGLLRKYNHAKWAEWLESVSPF